MREPDCVSRRAVSTNRLQCVECGRVSMENERGWTARLTVDDEVVVYCPDLVGHARVTTTQTYYTRVRGSERQRLESLRQVL